MLYKLTTFWRKKQRTVYRLIYIAAVVIFGIYHMGQGLKIKKAYRNGTLVKQSVGLDSFEMVDCTIQDVMTFKGEGDNARLIYNGDIDTLYIDCIHSYGLREFRAFYNTTGDYVFNEEDTLRPKQYKQYLVYDFPLGTKQVKMYYANSTMVLGEVVINSRDHTNSLDITTSDMFMLAVCPSILYLVADIVFSLLAVVNKKLNKK